MSVHLLRMGIAASSRREFMLDAVPGAVAAYSLSRLSTAYTGPVVRLRKTTGKVWIGARMKTRGKSREP